MLVGSNESARVDATDQPKAFARRAAAVPMRPRPITPKVDPRSRAIKGDSWTAHPAGVGARCFS